jgi:hypothetical protein
MLVCHDFHNMPGLIDESGSASEAAVMLAPVTVPSALSDMSFGGPLRHWDAALVGVCFAKFFNSDITLAQDPTTAGSSCTDSAQQESCWACWPFWP